MYNQDRDTLQDIAASLYSIRVQLDRAKDIGLFAMDSLYDNDPDQRLNEVSDIVHAVEVIKQRVEALRIKMEK